MVGQMLQNSHLAGVIRVIKQIVLMFPTSLLAVNHGGLLKGTDVVM